MTKFDDLGLAEPILRALQNEGYEDPTPIQAQVIPAMMEGHDVMGIAQTGTGKTAAFVLPILNYVYGSEERPDRKNATAVILAPTRELADQIYKNVRQYSKNMRAYSGLVVGGTKHYPQIKMLARGVDVLVATPGRLLDHVEHGTLKLDGTTTVVLDEADQMMDLGFLPAIRKILGGMPEDRQTILLSATMPKQVKGLAHDFLHNPKEIAVAAQSKPIERIEQKVIHIDGSAKRTKLTQLLKEDGVDRAIVFTRTKRGADRVADHLHKEGLTVGAIHGDKTQGQRSYTLRDFKTGRINILVATDVAARGIHIDGVSHVYNYELPNVPEAYVHRIGRTARAGESGIAISLCDRTERSYLRDIERLIKQDIPAEGEQLPPMPAPHRTKKRNQDAKPKRRNTGGPYPKADGDKRSGPKHTSRKGRPGSFKGQNAGEVTARDDRGGDDQPRGERKFGDKPRGERKFGDKPRGERKFGDKPRGERKFGDKPRGERKFGDKPRGERSFDDKPRGERKFDDKPRGERRADDKPRGERKFNDKPRGERSFDDKPRGERKFDGKPRSDKPKGERRFDDTPRSDKPKGERKFDTPRGEAKGGKPSGGNKGGKGGSKPQAKYGKPSGDKAKFRNKGGDAPMSRSRG